jgi:hypothetical protein
MAKHRELMAVVAAFLIVIAGECVRAAVSHHDPIGVEVSNVALVPAELDPAFLQKLEQRYQRARPSSSTM